MVENIVEVKAVGVCFQSVEMHVSYFLGVFFAKAFCPAYVKIAVVAVVNVVNSYCGTVQAYVVLLGFVRCVCAPDVKLVSEERPMPADVRAYFKSRLGGECNPLFFAVFISAIDCVEIEKVACLCHCGEVVMIWLYIRCVNGVEVLEEAVKLASLVLFGMLRSLIVSVFHLVGSRSCFCGNLRR